MSDFKETCIWMSYRYAIGRSTIAATTHALDIARNMDWIPKDRWEFTGMDILREINGRIKWYKNIHLESYGDPKTDIFSIIFEWFLNNPQDDNIEYFVSHEWYVDTTHGVINNIKERDADKIPEKRDGIYYESNIFFDYHDYKNWVKLANLFLKNTKYVTYEYDGESTTKKCIAWYEIGANYNKISKRYSLENELMSGWYIAQDYIKSVSDRP